MDIKTVDFRKHIGGWLIQRHPKVSPSSHTPVLAWAANRKVGGGGGGGSPKALDVVEEATGSSFASICSCLDPPNLLERLSDIGLVFAASSTAWVPASLSLTGVVCGTCGKMGGTGSTSSIAPSLVTAEDMLTPNFAVLSFLTLRASGAGENV